MECSKCEEKKELMPRRKVCRICYNAEKVIQRNNRIPNEHEDECTKCFQSKIIPKGKTWCKECKNDYEKLRKSKFTETKKEEEKQKSQEYYNKIKENIKEIVIDNNETKICTVCSENKTLDKYFVAKCRGTIRSACKECLSKDRKKYYQNNKQKTIKQNTIYQVARCKVDPEFKILKTLRTRLYHALKNQKADKKYRTKQLTGCELSFLKGYLEGKFTEGMTWENHGDWHLDHIRPCCSFDLKEEEEQKKCFHYTNLQPLWAKDNLSKGGKYECGSD
jgi:hypothetical protein